MTQSTQEGMESNNHPKKYDPNEPVTITLTREQWHKITNSLKNEADQEHAFATQFMANCVGREFSEETVARYVRNYEALDALRAEIEKIIMEPWAQKQEDEDNV